MVETAAVVDAGSEFVKTTYTLEGDGPLVLICYEKIQAAFESINVHHYPNVDAVISQVTVGAPTHIIDQWKTYARKCVQPAPDFFTNRFGTTLKSQLDPFKAARLFVPHKAVQIRPDAPLVDSLKSFPFLNSETTIASLKSELPTYLAHASDVSSDIDPLVWWQQQSRDLPVWADSFRKTILIQPSSAAAERVFSLLNNSFGSSEDLALQDYIEASPMLQYNRA